MLCKRHCTVLGPLLPLPHPPCCASQSLPLGSRPAIGVEGKGGGGCRHHLSAYSQLLGTGDQGSLLTWNSLARRHLSAPGPHGVFSRSVGQSVSQRTVYTCLRCGKPCDGQDRPGPCSTRIPVVVQPGRGQHTLNFVTRFMALESNSLSLARGNQRPWKPVSC